MMFCLKMDLALDFGEDGMGCIKGVPGAVRGAGRVELWIGRQIRGVRILAANF